MKIDLFGLPTMLKHGAFGAAIDIKPGVLQRVLACGIAVN